MCQHAQSTPWNVSPALGKRDTTLPHRQTFTRKIIPATEHGKVESSLSNRFCFYESMKRKLKIKTIYECRCNERLQTKRFTRLTYTGLVVELEHLKIKTRLTNEKFASATVKGECEI
jgi:hypothetical protein